MIFRTIIDAAKFESGMPKASKNISGIHNRPKNYFRREFSFNFIELVNDGAVTHDFLGLYELRSRV